MYTSAHSLILFKVWVASGAGVFIRGRQAARIHLDWRTTRNVYTVAGTQVGRSQANTNIYLSKEGRVNLGSLGWNDTKGAKIKRSLTHHFDQHRRLMQRDLSTPDEGQYLCVFASSFLFYSHGWRLTPTLPIPPLR